MLLPEILLTLERDADPAVREGYARYGIVAPRTHGWSMGDLQRLAKRIGREHALAQELWESGWYEARMLAALIDEPARVTAEQMDRWCADFDSWAICDTVCFTLFDRSPHAWEAVARWSDAAPEFERRAAFALLASLALHQKKAPDAPFLEALPLIERASSDPRNFVKKGVSWALVAIGSRGPATHAEALALADILAARDGAARWIGKDARRKLSSPATLRRVGKLR